MNWKKGAGYGVVLWVFMFVIISVFVAFNIYSYLILQIIGALIGGVISYILALSLLPKNIVHALQYGGLWVVIGFILDLLVSRRFAPEIFSEWTLWLGYVLVLVAPVLCAKFSPKSTTPHIPQNSNP